MLILLDNACGDTVIGKIASLWVTQVFQWRCVNANSDFLTIDYLTWKLHEITVCLKWQKETVEKSSFRSWNICVKLQCFKMIWTYIMLSTYCSNNVSKLEICMRMAGDLITMTEKYKYVSTSNHKRPVMILYNPQNVIPLNTNIFKPVFKY